MCCVDLVVKILDDARHGRAIPNTWNVAHDALPREHSTRQSTKCAQLN